MFTQTYVCAGKVELGMSYKGNSEHVEEILTMRYRRLALNNKQVYDISNGRTVANVFDT